jgi:nicotinate dehydrogenase subunit B
LLGVNTPLALNSNLHSDRPDNVIRVILEGVRDPASAQIGFMQGFGEVFNDAQLVDLIAYMRQRFAPDKPPWQDLPERVKALR